MNNRLQRLQWGWVGEKMEVGCLGTAQVLAFPREGRES